MNENRLKIILKASWIGIFLNILLATLKALVGMLANSIAIVVDAANNLTDAINSIITIIGAKVASRGSDKNHPFGHGRAEYISSQIIGVVILYVGITSLTESVKRILNPQKLNYSTPTIIVVSLAIVFKIFISIYYTKVGKAVKSESLIDSGKDAIFDVIIATATLISAIIYMVTGFKIEYYLSALISVFIIKTGYDIIKDNIVRLLGERVDSEISNDVIKSIKENFPEVYGTYDLVLHNYGPGILFGSVHVEVSDKVPTSEIDILSRKIQHTVRKETGVVIEAVGIYSVNDNDDIAALRNEVRQFVNEQPYVLQMHGFFYDKEENTIVFDMVMDLDAPKVEKAYEAAEAAVKSRFNKYNIISRMDVDVTDI